MFFLLLLLFSHLPYNYHKVTIMPKKFDEKDLNKGHLRKLQALRKSLGNQIADKAFGEWLTTLVTASASEPEDQNAKLITEALEPLAKAEKLRIPPGGYLVRRGRGRVIVEKVRGK